MHNGKSLAKGLSLSFLFLILGSAHGFGGDTSARESRRFVVSRASSEIHIDGLLSEPAWESATVIDLPYEWFPGENVEPPVRTECLVTHDGSHLYVGFRAHDPEPSKIRAHLLDRDQIETFIQDDYVGFLLDTFNDERRAYQFRVNPLGVQADAFNSPTSEDWQWDMIWDSAGKITAEGYTVEIALPFHQLRFPKSEGELTFGFSAMRSWPRTVRHRIQDYHMDYGDACMLCQINKLSGFEGLSSGQNVEIDPTLTAGRTDTRLEPTERGLEKGDLEAEPGVTARWGITSSITWDGTVNPDFSQVEADVAQLEVNERFALFFPEKRPFFLEGVDYFQTPTRAVFTRTVANPAWGSKLTGRIGGNALGLFVTRDRINNLVIPSNQSSSFDSVEQDVTGSVLRYRRDVGRSSSLGALYTGREATRYHNRLAGIDGAVQIAAADVLTFQYLHSDTLYPEEVAERQNQSGDAFGGRGLHVQYLHNTRDWSWSASYEDLSPGFRADFGFMPRVDFREALAWASRTWWGDPNDWWTSFYIGPGFSRTEDHDGNLTNQVVNVEGELQGPLQSRLYVNVAAKDELYNGRLFELTQANFRFEIQPAGSMRIKLDSDIGEDIDSFNTEEGDLLNVRLGIELKPGRHVNLNLSHSYQRLDVNEGTLFRENLTEGRAFYYFDVRKLVRLIVQYRSIDRNPALFPGPVEPELRSLFLQLLASYKLNPRTVIFVGYSDEYLGLANARLTRSNRTFFIKLGYAWTF
jgi:hypothetical protein